MVNKINTFAKECESELQKELPVIYKNQFLNHKPISVNYNGLLTDLTTYWNQETRFREGFNYDEETITIPNFFTKLDGVSKEVKEAKTQQKKNKLYKESILPFINSKMTRVVNNCNNFKFIDIKREILDEIPDDFLDDLTVEEDII